MGLLGFFFNKQFYSVSFHLSCSLYMLNAANHRRHKVGRGTNPLYDVRVDLFCYVFWISIFIFRLFNKPLSFYFTKSIKPLVIFIKNT